MRGLAGTRGVEAISLYKHVANKQGGDDETHGNGELVTYVVCYNVRCKYGPAKPHGRLPYTVSTL